ncbi:S9 family peptidase [Massilia sp. R2A-15]|uniref:alpha/beta hydrolase family protein n=1 Tax=Massilia sp. R2A-15 TaxID=3064278 RepID=UPI00273334C1|nr:S9 family peptidase [Massilia sp. R2A-15]WLI88608.1 S9 family peptidase [Massilia sp. R2A-15]
MPVRRFSSHLLLAFAGALAALPGIAADTASAAPVPIERFFNNPTFSGALLSPNGRFLAARVARKNSRDALAVIDLGDKSVKLVGGFSDADIGHFQWVNDDRLVFDVTEKDLAQGEIERGAGLYAVNRDGSEFRQLVERSKSSFSEHKITKLLPFNTHLLGGRPSAGSSSIYVTSPELVERGEISSVDLLRLDTKTGRSTTVQRPAHANHWVLDAKGEPRIVSTHDKDKGAMYYRDAATDNWRKLLDYNDFLGDHGAMNPVGFAPDGTLYVSATAGRDKRALYRFDLATGKRDAEPLVELADYDFSGQLVMSDSKLLGVRILSDARSTVWFDAGMKAVQQRIDALLPHTVNLVSVAPHAETPWVLVQSYSDVQPNFWNLFNTETGKLDKVGSSYEGVEPARMATQDAVRYKARDGLVIPAWLTLPKDKRKNLPLVVLVHGGPYVRGGEWGWHPSVQFLASRGYAVIEPEYRGSTGFGSKHYQAGWKQWGLKMQDDIADAAKWAIAEGIADPKRICIAGASYGGYATLMGLVNDPDLYKCGIDWVGVTDIGLLATGHWSAQTDVSDDYRKYGMPTLVGDLVKDAEQLQKTSPLVQAARITQPLLLAYGGADLRVPIYHGRKFYDAVKATNPNVEMVVYEEEGHGWTLPKNRIDFWSRVEKFLEKNIGKP